MKLNQLTISNFKGIRDLTINFDGRDASIHADNALGKTTILDAWTWLLFDKDSSGAAAFNLKTLGENGEPLHMLDHSVEAEIKWEHDPAPIVLRKVYREKWTKKRGSADKVFDGHTTEYQINGVPKSRGEYQAYIADVAPENIFRMLTTPVFFSEQLTWQARRELLVNAFGEVSDAEVLAANPELAQLEERLQRHSVDDLKKMELATRKKINEELNAIPGRVDEAVRAMPEIADGANPAALATKAQKLSAEIEALREQKATITGGGQLAEKRRELAELDAAVLTLKNKTAVSASGALDEKLAAARKAFSALATTEMDLQNQVSRNKADVDMVGRSIASLKHENAIIVQRWKEQSAKRFVAGGACPTCGQEYPDHLLAQQEADFNRAKAEALASIEADGKLNKAAIDERAGRLLELEASGDALATRLEDVGERLTEQRLVVKGMEASMVEPPAVEELPEYQEVAARQSAVLEEIAALKAGIGPAVAEVEALISAKAQDLAAINREITDIEVAATQQYRVNELKAREKELAGQFEESERMLFLVEQFQRARISSLEASINSRFELVRWKMFETQINGGTSETCVCTMGGVPYSDLNNAGRIQAGLDIIRTLAAHYGTFPPVWVDNRESVTRLPLVPQQLISLIVSEADKALRVELA